MADSVPSERTPSERAERAAADRGDRTPPHNIDAERSVLGGIIIRNDTFNHAAAAIDSNDFYRDAHRRIFNAMVELNERGDAIDLITLKEALTRSGELEDVGGVSYIARLIDVVPKATNVEHYATIVKEKSTLRSLISSLHESLEEAYAGADDADEILDGAEKRVFEVADKRIRSGFIPIADLVQESFDTLSKLQQHRGLVSGVPTGFTELDEMTAGLQPGDLVIVAARPSMGKTSFVLNIAQHVALNRERPMTVGFFSLEMSASQLFIRLLTAEARIDAHRLRSGYLSADDYGKLVKAVGTLETAKIFIDDSASISVLEMRAKSRRLKSEHGLDLLIIDYIQLMQGRGKFDNRQQELAAISRSLKGLAKELSVPILVLSQLSRAPEARSDRRPQLSDLRESGALEQDADVVMMIFRPGVYEKDNPDLQNVAEIIVAKQRNGPIGTANLAFLNQYTLFANIEQGMA